ncbi:MAG: hypothetical protein GC164_08245 [Phycisphaera sp.]|nr:hypothetical protein [Phycisphaera sp.]
MVLHAPTVLIQFSGESDTRVLQSGAVVDSDDRRIVVEFLGQVHPGSSNRATVYFNEQDAFHRQDAEVVRVMKGGEVTQVVLATVGGVQEAESRSNVRVCVAAAGIITRIGQDACRLFDVSGTGIGVISPRPLRVGSTPTLRLSHGGRVHLGQGRVQYCFRQGDGRVRAGLLSIDADANNASLSEVCDLIQREQQLKLERLRRMSASG